MTALLVTGLLVVLAIPIKDLALALPDNGSAEAGSPQRATYDLIATEFGPGYNTPLLVTADIITQHRPEGHGQQHLADDIAEIPGVAAHQADPEHTADLGLVRIVPQWGQSDPATTDLVQRLRAQAADLGAAARSHRHPRHRPDRRRHRRLRPARRRAAALRHRRRRPVADPADHRLPLDRGADQGDARLPALDRRPRSVPSSPSSQWGWLAGPLVRRPRPDRWSASCRSS